MRAVTFQAPHEVRIDDRPAPGLESRHDAVVSIEASGICGSDLHIYHGRVKMEPGFTIGHEFVGTVTEVGDEVNRVVPGDRVAIDAKENSDKKLVERHREVGIDGECESRRSYEVKHEDHGSMKPGRSPLDAGVTI